MFSSFQIGADARCPRPLAPRMVFVIVGLMWGILGVSAVALIPCRIVVADDDPTLQTIINAWENRKVPKTWRMEWKQVRTDMKGSLWIAVQELRRMNADVPDIFPTEDTKSESNCTLIVDDDRWRFDATGESWFMDQLVPFESSFSFDGFDSLQTRRLKYDEILPSALIHKSSERKFWVGQPTHAVSWWCWPLDVSRGGIDLTNARILDERRVLGDAELIGIEQTVKTEVHRYWVDSKTFLLRRAEISSQGRLRSVLSADYVEVQGFQVPKSWKSETYDGNMKLERQYDCVQQEFTIAPEIPDGEFHLALPKTGFVYDMRSEKEKDYWVKSNGDLYLLNQQELLLPYREKVARAENNVSNTVSRLDWSDDPRLSHLHAVRSEIEEQTDFTVRFRSADTPADLSDIRVHTISCRMNLSSPSVAPPIEDTKRLLELCKKHDIPFQRLVIWTEFDRSSTAEVSAYPHVMVMKRSDFPEKINTSVILKNLNLNVSREDLEAILNNMTQVESPPDGRR